MTCLTLGMMYNNLSRRHYEILFLILAPEQALTFHTNLTICMKCQSLFSGKNIINLSSNDFAPKVVKINCKNKIFFLLFQKRMILSVGLCVLMVSACIVLPQCGANDNRNNIGL